MFSRYTLSVITAHLLSLKLKVQFTLLLSLGLAVLVTLIMVNYVIHHIKSKHDLAVASFDAGLQHSSAKNFWQTRLLQACLNSSKTHLNIGCMQAIL
jgi:hypothetical protein